MFSGVAVYRLCECDGVPTQSAINIVILFSKQTNTISVYIYIF